MCRFSTPCRLPTPKLSSQVFLKRIVATPGDRLSIRQGRPVLYGSMTLVDVIQPCRHFAACNMRREITIPPDHYFVIGDNSGASSDSRFWGPVPARAIIGKVLDDREPADATARAPAQFLPG
jgi:signal peptidase I